MLAVKMTGKGFSHVLPPEHSTVAELTFGPATQQTVTTVTTTTTVSLPPLIMKPPKDLLERDPKLYPLAFSSTPSHLQRFYADFDGRPVRFQEQEDASGLLRKHQELEAKLQRHSGSIGSEEKVEAHGTSRRAHELSCHAPNMHNVHAPSAPKRVATPISISEAAEIASFQKRVKRSRSHVRRDPCELAEHESLNERVASGSIPALPNPSLMTPETETGPISMLPPKPSLSKHEHKRKRNSSHPSKSRLRELQDSGPAREQHPSAEHSHDEALHADAPMLNAAGAQPEATGSVSEERRRPNLPSILTNSQQDVSLPSPSLSPITAAANAASRQTAFEGPNMDSSSLSQLSCEGESHDPSAHSLGKLPSMTRLDQKSGAVSTPGPTIMDLPTVVDAFDSMPEAMQTYLMYQLLRRSAKPTLQMIASVVNPALKCDPFNVLPAELGLNITRFLDAQSMCRASQVSKRWRRLINSDEKAWKDLLDRDGFALPGGEIARAVREGWGWQLPGVDGFEEDLSKSVSRQSPEPDTANASTTTVASEDGDTTSSTTTTRKKRRSLAKHTGSKKLQRRPAHLWSSPTRLNDITSVSPDNRLLAAAQGPNRLASLAAISIPGPIVGLPSLKSMHLFKSLYQRHYMIRKAWMSDGTPPQHLAFRAHNRHVVTCLLFDKEKILTGSDDTKINVYDTKTGALRNRLEGHEGGVWALQYEGDTLVSGSTDRSVRVWDIRTGRCLHVFQGHTSTVRCLVILKPVQIGTASDGTPIMMPKEPIIITGSRDSTLRVWKLPQPGDRSVVQTSQPVNDRDNPYFLRTLSGHLNSVRAIAAHGDTLVSGSYDSHVRVWKISTGGLIHRLNGHTQKVYSVVLDHARDRCISGSMDNLVKIWDLQTGNCMFNLEGHTSLVGLLDLSHDRLVSAAADSTLRIWDPESGACKATLSAHTGAITCFQHDGHKVISGSDRTLKMWNVRNGECVKDLLINLSGVWQVRFDERRCVAAVQRNNLTYIEVSTMDHLGAESVSKWLMTVERRSSISELHATASPMTSEAAGLSSILLVLRLRMSLLPNPTPRPLDLPCCWDAAVVSRP